MRDAKKTKTETPTLHIRGRQVLFRFFGNIVGGFRLKGDRPNIMVPVPPVITSSWVLFFNGGGGE